MAQRPYVQIRSHSLALGTSTYLLGVHNSTHNMPSEASPSIKVMVKCKIKQRERLGVGGHQQMRIRFVSARERAGKRWWHIKRSRVQGKWVAVSPADARTALSSIQAGVLGRNDKWGWNLEQGAGCETDALAFPPHLPEGKQVGRRGLRYSQGSSEHSPSRTDSQARHGDRHDFSEGHGREGCV